MERRGVAGIGIGGVDEFLRDGGLGAAQNDARFLLAFGLRLARHGVLQGHRNGDVADFNGIDRNAPVGGLARDFGAQHFVGRLAVGQQFSEMRRADHFAQ